MSWWLGHFCSGCDVTWEDSGPGRGMFSKSPHALEPIRALGFPVPFSLLTLASFLSSEVPSSSTLRVSQRAVPFASSTSLLHLTERYSSFMSFNIASLGALCPVWVSFLSFSLFWYPVFFLWNAEVGEEEVSLDPLSVPDWIWKLNWQRQINKTKAYKLFNTSFTWHRSLPEEMKTRKKNNSIWVF